MDWVGKTVARVVYAENATHARWPDGTKKDGNPIIIIFTDGTEVSFSAASGSMDVVWATLSPNDRTERQPPTLAATDPEKP